MPEIAVQQNTVAPMGIGSIRKAQMPLAFVSKGDIAMVAKLRDKGDLHHHLENLGFVEGARVKVICESAGNLIVEIKGTQVAIDKTVAMRIITS